jgi:hypothetical protein
MHRLLIVAATLALAACACFEPIDTRRQAETCAAEAVVGVVILGLVLAAADAADTADAVRNCPAGYLCFNDPPPGGFSPY